MEVVDLAARENGWNDFMLLGGCENENHIARGLLTRLQKRIECRRRKHMDLIDNKHAIFSRRGGHLHLLDELAHIINAIIGRSVELHDVHRRSVVERAAGVALVASLAIGRRVLTVDGLGKDARTRSLADPARSAEQIGMGQTTRGHGIFQCRGQRPLPHDRIESRRTIFTRRY